MYVPVSGGKKACMPRYYKDWIYQCDDERSLISDYLVKQTQQRLAKTEAKLLKKFGANAPSIIHQSQQDEYKKMYRDAKKRQDL